jgi:hypothetical protein
MSRLRVWVFVVLACVVVTTIPGQILGDRILLPNGESVAGVIVEWDHGNYVVVAGTDGRLQLLQERDIESVQRVVTPDVGGAQHNVVFLTDGLVLRGIVTTYRPDGGLLLRTSNGVTISVDGNAILKILTLRSDLPTDADQHPPSEALVRTEVLTLEIELILGGGRRDRGASQTGSADPLADEIQAFEESLEDAQDAAAARQSSENAQDVSQITGSASENLTRLAELAAACEESGTVRDKGTGTSDPARAAAALQAALTVQSALSAVGTRELAASATTNLDRLKDRAIDPLADLPGVEERLANTAAAERVREIVAGTRKYDLRIQGEIAIHAGDLPEEVRRSIYDSYRHRDALGAAAANLLPVLNLGSWRQGDRPHALLSGIVSLAAYCGIPYVAALAALAAQGSDQTTYELHELGGGLWGMLPADTTFKTIGVSVMGAVYLYNVLRPLWFAHTQNEKLARALGID